MQTLSAYCLVLFLLGGCAYSAEKCPSRSEDTAWSPMAGRAIKESLAEYLVSEKSYDVAVGLFGSPEKKTFKDGVLRATWYSGGRRTGRTYLCDKLVEETHHVSFAILMIDFRDEVVQNCSVTFKEFIGRDKSPDPFSKSELPTEVLGCDAAVREGGGA